MATPHLRKSIGQSPVRLGFLLISVVLACFALSPAPKAFGVTPAPDGGYTNGNTAEGRDSLFKPPTGSNNTANGHDALYHNKTGSSNTATGADALLNNTGNSNTATGDSALRNNTSGSNNTATGLNALYSNQTGTDNTGNGVGALHNNTTGSFNTATGDSALHNNNGTGNTADGFDALHDNIYGYYNTANGFQALYSNTNGNDNTANGYQALYNNDGGGNTANGFDALYSNTIGLDNTANGYRALYSSTGSGNTADGYQALNDNTTGRYNIALGILAGYNLTTGNDNIDIGNVGVTGEGNTMRIGTEGAQTNTFIAGISGVTVAGGVGVIIDSNGHLGTVVSSERFKQDIHSMDKASEAILALKPVTFRYKHELDPEGIAQFGLVAEQVEKVNPDLVARAEKGQVYTVRYEAVNAMLLNEFLKEHRKVEQQEATIAKQQKQIEALTTGIQRVSDRLELSKTAPEIVADNQ